MAATPDSARSFTCLASSPLLNTSPVNDEQSALQRWFGNSNITGADGTPLLLYHGTKSSDVISEFSPGGVYGSKLTGDAYGVGTYLTTSPSEASSYAGPEGAVYAVYARGEMLSIPLARETALPPSHAQRLTEYASQNLLDRDKAKMRGKRLFQDFTNTDEAAQFFEEQRERWTMRGFDFDHSFPEVVHGPAGAFRVEFTDWDAPVQIQTAGDAWDTLKAVGFDEVQQMGFDGLMLERGDGSAWVICHKTSGNSIKSALSGDFSSTSPLLASRTEAQLQEEIARFCSKGRTAAIQSQFTHSAVAFHGSRNNIDFAADHDYGLGGFFSSSPMVAAGYGRCLHEVNLGFKHPLEVDACNNDWSDIPYDSALRALSDAVGFGFDGYEDGTIDSDTLARLAQRAGHDALVINNLMDGNAERQRAPSTEYVIFSSANVLSCLETSRALEQHLESICPSERISFTISLLKQKLFLNEAQALNRAEDILSSGSLDYCSERLLTQIGYEWQPSGFNHRTLAPSAVAATAPRPKVQEEQSLVLDMEH